MFGRSGRLQLSNSLEVIMNDQAVSSNSVPGCLLRLSWMIGGNIALFILAIYIGRNQLPLLSWPDFAYWAVIIGMIVFRYADIRFFAGQNAYGEPSTINDWRKYAITAILVSALLFAGAHLWGTWPA